MAMDRKEDCNMRRRSILGPILLITIGVLFALDYIWGKWDFSQTWPVILVVIGTVKLIERVVWEDQGYNNNGPRHWGPPWSHGTPPNPGAYPGAVPPPPPPGTAQTATPPPSATPEYPVYPSSMESGSKSGDGHAS
jgi:hypothetical protein